LPEPSTNNPAGWENSLLPPPGRPKLIRPSCSVTGSGPGPDGSAGKGVVLETSEPLYQPDGMRLAPDGRLLLVEGRGAPGASLKEGRLDEVRISGDRADIKVLRSGFELPTAVTAEAGKAWVLESKFDYLRNPAVKGQDPGSFHVYGVGLDKR